jgi:hypothetical protein
MSILLNAAAVPVAATPHTAQAASGGPTPAVGTTAPASGLGDATTGPPAGANQRAGTAGSGPTIDAEYRLRLTPDRPGSVGVVLSLDLPETVSSFRVSLPDGTTLTSTEGFDRGTDGRLVWDGTTAEPTVAFRLDLPSERLPADGSVDTGEWALVTAPEVPVEWKYTDGEPSYRTSMTVAGEGVADGGIAYLGPYRGEAVTADDQRLRLIVPEMAESTGETVTERLRFAARALEIGDQDPGVAVFVVPEDGVAVSGAAGAEYRDAFWIRGEAQVGAVDDPWVHEYVHSRQNYTTTEETDWIVEGSADYYAALTALHDGEVRFDRFHEFVGSTPYQEAVLADRSTYADGDVVYSKGRVVVAALDARLRRATDGEVTFADVHRRMNRHDGPLSYADLRDIVTSLSDESVGRFLDTHVRTDATPDVPDDVSVYAPPSLSDDTDGDGLIDFTERTFLNTSVTTADTDGDGLDDGAELREYGTNPTEADTDGDGVTDGAEVRRGTDPLSAPTATAGSESQPDSEPDALDPPVVALPGFTVGGALAALAAVALWAARVRR